MADIVYDDVVKLAEQLSPQEQVALAEYLIELTRAPENWDAERKAAIHDELVERAQHRQLTNEERKLLLDVSIMNDPILVEPSLRREDWYDDDGR